ncbi:MAG: UDP-N-acetylmuramoyl-tripeptide--D-alanyl-D-alanine ligase [Gammaproteobacteria bacterium]
MQMLLSEIARITGGCLIGQDAPVSSVSIDTRTIKPGDLYVGIKGCQFDGNDFVGEAAEAGAIAAMVQRGVPAAISTVVVDDTRLALADLAAEWRKKSSATIVGLTGSNGKTTVKEMVAAILSETGSVLYTQGNLNNEIGVPLTLLRLTERHQFGVIEMGANHAGEIAFTSKIANPDVAIITNAGAAHLEGFGSIDGVARAKGEIFEMLKPEGVAIINHDDTYFDYWKGVAGKRQSLSFGLNEGADVKATAIKTEIIENRFATTFRLSTAQGGMDCTLRLAGRHNVINALSAGAAALALGIDLEQIRTGLKKLQPVTGRLQPLVGRKGNIVIDDTYNANSASLKAGLDVLAAMGGEPWLVMGAFAELGSDTLRLHREMGEMIKSSGVSRLLAIGSDAKMTVEAFGKGASFFDTQEELIASLKRELKGTETILIKGSRMRRMENVAAALVENYRV